MITVYYKSGASLLTRMLEAGEPVPPGTLWIDMQSPSQEEELAVEKQLNIQIPSKREVWKNQVLNRLYQEDGVSYMTAALISKVDSPYPQTSSVTFILAPGYLLTMRYIAPTSFNLFAQRVQQMPQHFNSSCEVLEGLLEEIINRVAHNSEVVVEALDQLSHSIFGEQVLSDKVSNTSQMMKNVLKQLGASNDLNSKISESLHSLDRVLCFFKHLKIIDPQVDEGISTLMTDTTALIRQTSFLSDKITFQLDATLGMINVEQNLIIKIFSVVAVFLMPPTLISSMYGMNFSDMPELHWQYGYPMAVGLMAGCALAPYFYFRKKGWL